MRAMTEKEIASELTSFREHASNRSFLIRETSNAYKCDRFLWRDESIKGSGRFHTAAYKDDKGAVMFYGDYAEKVEV